MLVREDAIEALQEVANTLEFMKVEYWIDSGTLLSAYRDKDINKFDHDIDIRVHAARFIGRDQLSDLIKNLFIRGFYHFESPKTRLQLSILNEKGIFIDLKFCYQDSDDLWYFCFNEPDPTPILHVYPRRFFNPLGKIELFGREYPCPQPVEEYLVHHYGEDWRKFKVRVEEANETDLTWDYMHDPPCSMTMDKFNKGKDYIPKVIRDE